MKHITPLVLAAVLTLTAGCAGMKAYLPVIDASIIGGRGIVQATKDTVVAKEDLVGCYVTSALITALDASKQTIDSWVTSSVGDKVIPAVEVDIAACHALAGDAIKPVMKEEAAAKVNAILKSVMPTVTGVLGAVLESSDVTCRDLVIAKGVLKYIENAAPAVIEELGTPDGKMTLPAVTMNFDGCDTSSPDAVKKGGCDCEAQCKEPADPK